MTSTIALIADDNSIRQIMNVTLSEAGHAVLEMNARTLGMEGSTDSIDAVCVGVPDVARFDWLHQILAIDADLPVIVITDQRDFAERAVREGAYEVLAKSMSASHIRRTVQRAVERRQLTRKVAELNQRLAQYEGDEVVPIRELERQAIERALRATRGSVTKAAKLLGIGRATLYRRLASPDMADIRARRNGEPVPPATMSSMSQATMARQP